ncbi:DNA-directed RNA polymerase I subunit RPA43 [Triplophysa dalaica]|uniref:DNA-directed RNA polymerase I subunit RPA43 n=1 Tax=Triplophysa dalaica TaxID=1582913 RepID=UPI0024DFB9B8|nr:DNA-directed RNA polymerase I subunit RPA43 [Triplophysa dalaica]
MANWSQEDGATKPVTNPTNVSSERQTHGGEAPAVPCLIPSFAEAVTLLSSRYSCLVLDTHRRHVLLPPAYLRKKRTGLQEEFDSELLKFSRSLKGVPMAYDNIKIVGQHGDIYDDQGFIHLDVEASFVIFKPKKGSKLVGVINKIAVGHLGCLVHGCFNACVMKPSQLTPEQWRDCGLRAGESVEFEVFQLDSDCAGVLIIRGRLEKSRVQELLAQPQQTEASVNLPAEPENTEDTTDSPKHKKKKKKKDKRENKATSEDSVDDSGLSQTCDNHEPNVNETELDLESSKPHKKKKKDKREKQATSEDSVDEGGLSQTCNVHEPDVDGMEVDTNSNSLHKKKKKKDKRKDSDEVSPPSDLRARYFIDKTSRKRPAADQIEDHSETTRLKKKKNGL